MIRNLMLAAAAVSLAGTSVAAQAAPKRAPAQVEGQSEELVGLLWQYLILPVVIAVVISLISGDDDTPKSP